MFAIIATGGKQYRVKAGDVIKVELLPTEKDGMFEFTEVLLAGEGEKVTVGKPTIAGAKVTAKVLEPMLKDVKKVTFKYTHKERYKRKVGHRQKHTQVKIEKITV